MQKNPVGWFEIYVDNMDRAKQFYQSILAVNLVKSVTQRQATSQILNAHGIE